MVCLGQVEQGFCRQSPNKEGIYAFPNGDAVYGESSPFPAARAVCAIHSVEVDMEG